jgi:hypothetical protein
MASEFDLEVEFAGLCMYVPSSDGKEVTVLLPDARKNKLDPTFAKPHHADKTSGIPHAGYVRFDLKNLMDAIPTNNVQIPEGDKLNGPRYEVVHRLIRNGLEKEEIDFGLPDPDANAAAMEIDLDLPHSEKFATVLQVIPEAYNGAHKNLLARTVLKGGKLVAEGKGAEYAFSRQLAPGNAKNHSGKFAGFATWTRKVEGEQLTLTITGPEEDPVEIRLKPDGSNKIVLKIANLCSDNPLEWNEFGSDDPVRDRDEDFKWLYSLLQPTNNASWKDLLGGTPLPVPELNRLAPPGLGLTECMGVVTPPPGNGG